LTVKKEKHHEITGVIRCVSGLRIGGGDDLLQIGGTDLTCIKHPVTLKPYLPGSSLKGKMRSELEQRLGKIGDQGKPCGCAQPTCLVCRIFGPHAQTRHQLGPARIIVRDGEIQSGGETETKSSTAIDRNTGAALRGALRSEQRVVAGSTFGLRIGIHEWDLDKDVTHNGKKGGEALIAFVLEGMKLVQQSGLGSGVSKGSGEVHFDSIKCNGADITLG
jgi:CRISPR-associated protein Csm3